MVEEKKKILQVDDEPDITYIVEFVLTNGGFDVVRLNDSTQTIPELLANDYSLLILDLMMPKMSGFDILENLRKENRLAHLNVLILSSRQLSNGETEFLRDHRADMMSKPFEPFRLLEKVREIVTR